MRITMAMACMAKLNSTLFELLISLFLFWSSFADFSLLWNQSGMNYASFTRKKKNSRCLINVVRVPPHAQLIILS